MRRQIIEYRFMVSTEAGRAFWSRVAERKQEIPSAWPSTLRAQAGSVF